MTMINQENTAIIIPARLASTRLPNKPLLPINGKPILEIILEQCINSGIRNFFISVHYLADKIINYFGDGAKWDVNINYVKEVIPLGTAGALKLLPNEFDESIICLLYTSDAADE